jgi:predicted choloylglycine hydrolase
MLRYVLETCRQVEEAIAALGRIPVALAQNVMLLDRSGACATLFLAPGRTAVVSPLHACTNHQEMPAPPHSAVMQGSLARQQALLEVLAEPAMRLATLLERFLQPPLYARRIASPTVYTAVYRPVEGRVDYVWPGHVCRQRMGRFAPGEYIHDYGELEP